MNRRIIIPATLSLMLAGAAYAVEPMPGAVLGTSLAEISTALSAEGFELTKYEKEGNGIEVDAIKGETRTELLIDAATGTVTWVEMTTRRGPSTLPGVSDDAIRAALLTDGYTVTRFERERGKVEVYAMKNGRQWELEIDPRTGDILSLEAED